MSTVQTAKTQFTTVDGVKIAYRRFGKKNKYPLLYLNHLRGSLDTIDPLLFNSIAKNREVILFDNTGIGHSDGTVKQDIQGMAEVAVGLLKALGIEKVDALGFSMGGGVAQVLGYDYPEYINKLVLAGTQSAIGDGVVLPPKDVLTNAAGQSDTEPDKEMMQYLFFYPSETSRKIGDEWWERIHERNVEGEKRIGYLIGVGAQTQLGAIFKNTVNEKNFARLKDIKAPTLVTNGHNDIMSPTPNSFVLQQNIKDAELHIYPDSGHGHLFQFAERYATALDLFLEK